LRQPWRKAYAAELAEYPRLLAMLDGNGGVDAVYNAAGVTPGEQEAIEWTTIYGVRWSARQLGKAYGTVSNLRLRGLARLYTWLSANRVEHREIE
jgi:hypothetical protein